MSCIVPVEISRLRRIEGRVAVEHLIGENTKRPPGGLGFRVDRVGGGGL